eukprot:1188799-Prorocentrum_minimum.AAC.3
MDRHDTSVRAPPLGTNPLDTNSLVLTRRIATAQTHPMDRPDAKVAAAAKAKAAEEAQVSLSESLQRPLRTPFGPCEQHTRVRLPGGLTHLQSHRPLTRTVGVCGE